MRLHIRVLLIITSVTLCMMVAAAAIVWPMILVNYARIENAEMTEQVARVSKAMGFQADALEAQMADWAQWDDTYEFLKGQKPDYHERNIAQPSTYKALGVTCLGFYSFQQGPLLFLHDPLTGQTRRGDGEAGKVFSDLLGIMSGQQDEQLSGLITIDGQLMLFAVQAVRDSTGEGDSPGYMMMAKPIDEAFRDALAMVTHPSLRLQPVAPDSGTVNELQIEVISSEKIRGAMLLPDVHGKPALSATVTMERSITEQSRKNLQRILAIMAVFGALMVLITYFALVRYVLRRIDRLRHEVGRIRDSGQLSSALGVDSRDEIGELVSEFNSMVARLAKMREQLDKARQEAESINEARGRFMANMSHEIRTPMTAILGYSELMADNPKLDDQTRHYLKVIQDNSEMLLRLINDILDLSRIEVGRLSVSNVAVDVASLVSECVAFFNERAAIKRIGLKASVTTDIPGMVMLDPVRLRQILLNLIGNAVKFTEHGNVQASLSVKDGQLLIEVSDTGIGIDAAELGRIFEPFWQANTEVHRRYTGFGLGLVVSRQLARLMGGDIDAHSVPGRGSTFTVRLPLLLADAPSCDYPETQGSQALHGRILLAEDNDVNRMLLRTMLEKLGLKVLLASNGEEALEILLGDKTPVDMVFMDMMMPVLDGVMATRRLRAAGFDKPIVALTASAMPEERELAMDAGCSDFAGKPISQSALQALCEKHIPQAGERVLQA